MPNSSARRKPDNTDARVESALAWLQKKGSKAGVEGMARFAITAEKAFGVSMRDIQSLAKTLGRDHDLAAQLWATGWYEARMLACYVDDPSLVTPKQMDEWIQDFDNWAICDTTCFALFDRTPHAWKKVDVWSRRKKEFEKRSAFALLWGLSVHDKKAEDDQFLRGLLLIEQAADDERHFVKKAVNMALRGIGKRNQTLNAAGVAIAKTLGASSDPTERWIGKDALRELTSDAVAKRLVKAGQAPGKKPRK